MINPVSALALLSVFVSLLAAVSAYPMGRVPDWEDLRPLPWIGFSAALMAGGNLAATLDVPAPVYTWLARVQVLAVALHIAAWHAYLPGWARRPERIRLWPLLALGALALVPGAVFGSLIRLRPVPWLGVVYRDPNLTWTGQLLWAALGAYGIWGWCGWSAGAGPAPPTRGRTWPVPAPSCSWRCTTASSSQACRWPARTSSTSQGSSPSPCSRW